MVANIGQRLYGSRSPTGADLAEAKRIVNEGYAYFVGWHDWSFLHPESSIVLWPTVTGTAAVTTTAIEDATNDPFLPSMVGHKLIMDTSETEYTITEYTDAENVTVDSSAAADDGDTFTITPDGNYTLPDDFAEPESRLSYGADTGYAPLGWTGADVIRAKRAGSSSGYHPMLCSLQAMELSVLIGQRWELPVWPTPATETTLYYQYLRNPAAFSADADYPVGGMRYSRAVMQCAYAALETEQGRTEGPEAARAERMLTKVLGTNARQQPRILGSNRDNSDQIRQPTDPMIWQGGLDMT